MVTKDDILKLSEAAFDGPRAKQETEALLEFQEVYKKLYPVFHAATIDSVNAPDEETRRYATLSAIMLIGTEMYQLRKDIEKLTALLGDR